MIMKGKSRYFMRRGTKTASIKFDDEVLDIVIRVPTNREHDEMMEAHTEYGQDGSVEMHGADLIEDRLVQHIVDLPFDIPTDDAMEAFTPWKDASIEERTNAINTMDPEIRDAINNAIAGTEEVDGKTAEN
jgi:hypothetical protein